MCSERKGVQKLSLRLFWQCTDALVVIARLQDAVDQPTGSSAWYIFPISRTVYNSDLPLYFLLWMLLQSLLKKYSYIFFLFLFYLDSYPRFPIHKIAPIPLHPFIAAISHWFTHCPVLSCVAHSGTIQMDTAGTSESSVLVYQTTWHQLQEERNIYIHHHDNLKCNKPSLYLFRN
jgi:hypothetical protein